MNMRQGVLTAIIILAAVMAVIVGIYALQEEDAGPGGHPITATLSIEFGAARGNASVRYTNLTVSGDNATVYGLTMAAAEEGNFNVDATYYGQYDSLFITAIDGVANGQNDSYWQYTVNGTAGEVGADKRSIADGDHVTWAFEESPFGG